MKRVIYFAFAVAIGLITTDAFAIGYVPIQEGNAAQDRKKIPKPPVAESSGRQRGPAAANTTPVALKDGVAELSPENSKVDFVGTHVGDEPKPRLGGFQKFKGTLKATEDGSSLQSITIEFETGSLWTELGGDLTNHLKNADFLNVEEFPTAKFTSTKIQAGEKEGMLDVVGKFTLMDKTNEITIPVKMKKSDGGVLVKGDFKLDRGIFGMTKMAERVSNEVAITLSIGEKTTGGLGASGQGRGQAGAGGRGGRGGRGGGDPSSMFKNQDANGDGKLSGDEIPEFFKGRMEQIDADGDKAITLEELQKMIQSRRGGRGQ